MDNYGMETQLHCILRQEGPEWRNDNDSFLIDRVVPLKHGLSRYAYGAKYRELMPGQNAMNTAPRCWLLYYL